MSGEYKKNICVIYTVQEMKDWLQTKSKINLYGAGKVCNKLLEVVRNLQLLDRVDNIYVTSLDRSGSREVQGIELQEYTQGALDSAIVLLAVGKKAKIQILRELADEKCDEIVVLAEHFEWLLDRFMLGDKNVEMKQKYMELQDKILTYSEKCTEKQEHRSDILFLSPPFWDVYSPFSAVPCLVGALKKEGYKCRQVDVGIKCFHFLLKTQWRQHASYFLTREFFKDNVLEYEKNPYSLWEEYVKGMWFLQGDEFDYSFMKSKYKELNAVQKRVLDALYTRVYSTNMSNIDFDECKSIDEALERYMPLGLYETLSEEIIDVFCNIPDVVGISITSTGQFIPGCILSKLLKKCKPEVKIVVGGSCLDLFAKSSYEVKEDINKYFDYIIVGEGETAIVRLMQYFEGKISLSDVPNLLLINKDGTISYTEKMVENVTDLPIADYDGLELDLYMAPETILPYQTSRGCHYGYCAFCNHDEKYRHNYRSKDAKTVVQDLLTLSEKYNVNHFQFVDEAIRPDCFKEMVDEMERYGKFKEIKWFYYSRVSRQYDEEILDKAKRNGCEMVMFGVETLNQRLLNFIKKGISADVSRYCLQLFHRQGIKTYAWLMCNLPSETLEEAEADLEEVKGMHEYIDAFSVGPFMLVRNTDMYLNPESYGITEINHRDPFRFASCYEGIEIDREKMLEFYHNKYAKYQMQACFMGNRYTVFFE